MDTPEPSTGTTGRGIQSIEIGGRLLRVLAEAARPMMLRDLADAAGMPPGQAHAYLVSFRKIELVEQDGVSGRYRLGPFALHLGLARLRGSDVYEAAAASAVELAERLNLAVAVCVWGTHGATVVRIHESSRQIHVNVRPGTVFGLTTTATGKLFAALLPERLVLPLLEAELRDPARRGGADAEDVTLDRLRAELSQIRRTGISTIRDRPVPGVSALAAPVFDHSGQMQAAIMMMGPTALVDCSPEGEQARALLGTTRGISERFGHRPPDAASASASASASAGGAEAGVSARRVRRRAAPSS
ncbi:IclR family transcriptional regulator [Azospirillum sp. ST 5-10]|uniref:IclR family transcriptional regulator n=1 Tax=unclassified Azospirillum TaxID=2630922 RepID=UPI003F4A4228